jgi:mono/diheme cytochrome c family protein
MALGLMALLYGRGTGANAAPAAAASTPMPARQALAAWANGTDLEPHPTQPQPPFDNNLRLLGGAWYGQLCTPCHGAEGDGKGPRAGQLYPRPRDFTKGVYEFRSTPTGTLPTDEDIWKVVSGGLHGTAMVPWITFSENDRWALVAYVESFSPRFAHERRDDAIKMTDAPAETPQLIAQGHGLFGDAGCTECHGIEGRGDGPSSSSLVDAAGLPIRPLDFHGRVFRRGSSMRDIYLTVSTGLDGTPMPSYASSLTAEQSLALAAYVRSLIGKTPSEAGSTPSASTLEARRQERFGMMIDMPGMGRLPICRDIRPRPR